MILSATPVRVSLFGGSTDYPIYLKSHQGMVVGGSINQYIYLCARYLPGFFEWKTSISYSKTEHVNTNNEIEHKAIRAVANYVNITDGFELSHMADLPSKTGIGSSSSFIVGLLHIFNALKNNECTKKQLYQNAVHIEQEILKECVGLQDSAWAAYGGLNYIKFYSDPMRIDVIPIPISHDNVAILENNLLLFVTGQSRRNTAHDITSKYVPNILQYESHLKSIYDIAKASIPLLSEGYLDEIGTLLDISWMSKKAISSNISNEYIDNIYDVAKRNGALGGKLLGAGGGGNIMLYVPKENQPKVRDALKNLIEIPFKFENDGSKIILNTLKTQ